RKSRSISAARLATTIAGCARCGVFWPSTKYGSTKYSHLGFLPYSHRIRLRLRLRFRLRLGFGSASALASASDRRGHLSVQHGTDLDCRERDESGAAIGSLPAVVRVRVGCLRLLPGTRAT